MSYFSSVSAEVNDCDNRGGCAVTIRWSFVTGASFDGVEITRNIQSGGQIGIFDAAAGEATIRMWYANLNQYILTARTLENDEWADNTTLPDGRKVPREDPSLSTTIAVDLPPPPDSGPQPPSGTPGKPRITHVTVQDGSLRIGWEAPRGKTDIDGYRISIIEAGQTLRPMDAKPSHRSATFAPTKENTDYNIGVSAYNDMPRWPDLWEEQRFHSPDDWLGAHVPEGKGWPPSGQWQSWAFPRTNAFDGSGRDALAAVSRAPNIMDVFWIERVLSRPIRIGKVRTAFYRDGVGFGYADLPVGPNADFRGPIAALSRKHELVEIFWATSVGSIDHAWWEPRIGWQHGQLYNIPRSIQPGTPLAAISRADNHMEIFWISPEGAVRHGWWYAGDKWRFGEIAPAGSVAGNGGLAACSRAPNTMEVFWIAADGSVDHAYWYEHEHEKGWRRGRIGEPGSAVPTSRLAVVSRHPRTMEIFWVGKAGALKNAWWYDGAQAWGQGVVHGSGVSALAGIAAVSRQSDTMEVFWVSIFPTHGGPHAGLHNSFWYEAKNWQTDSRLPRDAAHPAGAVAAVARLPNTMEVWTTSLVGAIHDHYIYFK